MAESAPTEDESETEPDVGRDGDTSGGEEANGESSISDDSLLKNPDIKLEDCRHERRANHPRGRGPGTASGRGYNAERLVKAVLNKHAIFTARSSYSWYDSYSRSDGQSRRVEAKCCVEQYPSGGPGRFRIWRHNHDTITRIAKGLGPSKAFLYFFIVYSVEDGIEREVGKLVTTVEQIDAVVEAVEWPIKDHNTMGRKQGKDISWTVVLDRLGVSEERFRTADAVDLTIRESE